MSLNGRVELWRKMGREVVSAPLIGHGYFVTSAGGEIEVWGSRRAVTAHNVVLQVLVSTGLIGVLLFFRGLWRPMRGAARSLRDRGLRELFAVMLLWYLGWGALTDSFMGPVRAESIVFFTLLGVAVARAQSSAGS
jgi:O-antigen ligase